MIPPRSSAVLAANPLFARFHQTLVTKHLDHDASTRVVNEGHAATGLEGRLKEAREEVARRGILVSALTALAEGAEGSRSGSPEGEGVDDKVDNDVLEEGKRDPRDEIGGLQRGKENAKPVKGARQMGPDDNITKPAREHHGELLASRSGNVRDVVRLPDRAAQSKDVGGTYGQRRSNDADTGSVSLASVAALPAETRSLIMLIVSYITHSSSLTQEEHDLMKDDLNAFQNLLHQRSSNSEDLSPLLSQHLVKQHARLRHTTAQIIEALPPQSHPQPDPLPAQHLAQSSSTPSPSTPQPPTKPPPTFPLHSQILYLTQLQTHILTHSLTNNLHNLLTSTTTNLSTQATHLTTSFLPDLESTAAGPYTRLLTSHAAFSATVAKGLAAKAKAEVLEMERDMVDCEEFRSKYKVFEGQVQELEGRREGLEEVLGEFEDAERGVGGRVGDKGVLKRLGLRYGEIEVEMEEVRGDLERLRGSAGLIKGGR